MNVQFRYKRDRKGRPIGVVAVDRETMDYGWSLCHKADKWDRELARTIAIGRLYSPNVEKHMDELPFSMQKTCQDAIAYVDQNPIVETPF